jgi:hypothetical protein
MQDESSVRQRCREKISALDTLLMLLGDHSVDETTLAKANAILVEAIKKLEGILESNAWPEPTIEPPSMQEVQSWIDHDGSCQTSDGCHAEPDGVCAHRHPSWLVRWAMI